MLRGLDLFSGIGGISIALEPWVRTIAYCERDRHAQSVLLSRMAAGDIDRAPIWDDVTSLSGSMLPNIDIIYGGFPCQDISVAGRGGGLEGKRSGLFFEIVRLATELKPAFLFLENVPAIRTRGLDIVIKELSRIGYDCRWTVVSAAELGAPHLRKRWFLLAYNNRSKLRNAESRRAGGVSTELDDDGGEESLAYPKGLAKRESPNKADTEPACGQARYEFVDGGANVADTVCERGSEGRTWPEVWGWNSDSLGTRVCFEPGWWSVEPDVGRVANGVSLRVDRLRGLGNAVVPAQAREAFQRLMGL